MNIRPQTFDAQFVAQIAATGEPANDAVPYGVSIAEANVAEGQTYWRAIGIHHLTPAENGGDHHVYLEALDEAGRRLQSPPVWVNWTWEGRKPDEAANPVPLDKGSSEPAGNLPMGKGQKVTVWVAGLGHNAADLSDRVGNLHTIHPDEPGPHGELWNSIGHHSFYVVFQRVTEVPSGDGLIQGHIANGRAYQVRLLRGDAVVAQQTADETGSFAFAQLRPGTYRLEATGPSLTCDQILLDTNHKQITLDLTP